MSTKSATTESCQIDFYLLGGPAIDAEQFACRLAMMAWEQRQKIFIVTASDRKAGDLDALLWHHPQGRFLPHATSDDPHSGLAPVNIGTVSVLSPTDVVINLCDVAIPHPKQFERILEIVPHAEDKREKSREKYRSYRNHGITPRTHEISA